MWEAFQDGEKLGTGENLAPWHPIKPGGVLILGQEQVSAGGQDGSTLPAERAAQGSVGPGPPGQLSACPTQPLRRDCAGSPRAVLWPEVGVVGSERFQNGVQPR